MWARDPFGVDVIQGVVAQSFTASMVVVVVDVGVVEILVVGGSRFFVMGGGF